MKSNIANNTFLKRKLDIVKRGEFEERLQIHMYQKGSFYIVLLCSFGNLTKYCGGWGAG